MLQIVTEVDAAVQWHYAPAEGKTMWHASDAPICQLWYAGACNIHNQPLWVAITRSMIAAAKLGIST